MRKLLLALAFALTFIGGQALADNTVIPCYKVTGTSNCVPVSAANPLPVTAGGGGGGGTSSDFNAAFPTAGTAIGLTDGTSMRALTGINYTGTSYAGAMEIVAPIVAGTNVIGKFGIDQTTPGTTNGFSLSQVGATTILTGAGATGAGSPRDTVAQDSNTIAGSTPGTNTPIRTTPTTGGGTTLTGNFLTAGTAPGAGQGVSCVYNSTAQTLTNGQGDGCQLDSQGNLLTASRAITPVVSTSAENSHVIKGSAGTLLSVYATNQTATAGFLVVINATTAPADGAITPLDCAPLPANGYASLNYNPGPGTTYSTGIVAVLTSAATCFTKTTGTITGFIKGAAQ